MKKIKAVLWDMDGTLVDSEYIAMEALALAMQECGLPVPEGLHHMAAGRASDTIYNWLKSEYGLSLDPAAWEKRKHFHYFRAGERLRGFDDAVETWRRLDTAGVAQAVVSNSDRAIMDVNLRSAGLVAPGLITVSRNDVRNGKPDPEGYQRAAWLLGVAQDECVIVEDSTSGAAAGLASGMPTYFVPHATVSVPSGVQPLATMRELEDLVLGEANALRQA